MRGMKGEESDDKGRARFPRGYGEKGGGAGEKGYHFFLSFQVCVKKWRVDLLRRVCEDERV